MIRLLPTVCLIAGLAALAAPPATAQFNPFEALFGPPPRPPGGVPGGRQVPTQPAPQEAYPGQQQYPRQQPYPGQPYPGQANIPPQGGTGGIQSQPLPPPPGGTAAVDPRAPLSTLPPGQRPQRGAPADPSPQPGDDVIADPPSQKITNK